MLRLIRVSRTPIAPGDTLQLPVNRWCVHVFDALSEKEEAWRASLSSWIALFGTDDIPPAFITRTAVLTDTGNIAGVAIPIYKGVETRRAPVDLLATPPWLDDAGDALAQALAFDAEREVLEEQRRLINEELRTTSQRVNLFEKV